MSRPIHELEAKWQKRWEEEGVYRAQEFVDEKFYGLIEFPYPSGEGLHVGHPRSYTAIDLVTRKKRMEGKNVLYPIGWDAFGLPAENYAIKNKIKPAEATKKNIANFTRQIKSLGFGFDWSRAVDTTDPAYYKWTQWQFLQFFKHGLAYKATSTINWCPRCKIGLANEEAQGGVCERCGTPVEKRDKEQWMIRITDYAERLLSDLNTVDYLDKIKAQQINWIGKSEGALIRFTIEGGESIEVFTTRPDTIFGVTYLVLAPEHSWVTQHLTRNTQPMEEVQAYIAAVAKKTEEERTAEEKEKTGVRLPGVFAVNPVNGERVSVWIADYVLANYGTGAVMAVPAHDERDHAFAKKYGLPIRQVVSAEGTPLCPPLVRGERGEDPPSVKVERGEKARIPLLAKEGSGEVFMGEGHAINSDFLNGAPTWKAKEDVIFWLEEHDVGERKVTYKLRDWVFSRQRYWGEPIPLVYCQACANWVPLPDDQLPLKLPEVEAYEPTDTGESPLAKIEAWVATTCPRCGGKARRETDTMPNWAGSSWYFLRYCDPQNDKALASPEALKYWMPVDLYNGGMEHTTLHLLYSRFWYKFLWDLGVVPKECGPEPYKMRRSHNMILGEGGVKMSKSKGNVVNPDDVVAKYGADVFRVYEMFIGPYDQPAPWDTNGIEGVRRFLDKVWGVFDDRVSSESVTPPQITDLETLYHQTVKKVTEGIENLQFNTCVSQLMIFTNELQEHASASKEMMEGYVKLIAPFAPHVAEEIWREKLGHTTSIHARGAGWPMYDPAKLQAAMFELVVQVNGKVRDKMTVDSDISEDEAKSLALASEKVRKWLEGKEPKQAVYIKGRLVSLVV